MSPTTLILTKSPDSNQPLVVKYFEKQQKVVIAIASQNDVYQDSAMIERPIESQRILKTLHGVERARVSGDDDRAELMAVQFANGRVCVFFMDDAWWFLPRNKDHITSVKSRIDYAEMTILTRNDAYTVDHNNTFVRMSRHGRTLNALLESGGADTAAIAAARHPRKMIKFSWTPKLRSMIVPPRPPITVNIYWIRHATSCTNAIARSDPWYKQWQRAGYLDPPIIDAARARIADQSKKLRKIVSLDLFYSSKMLRAQMTAAWWAPRGKKISIVHGLEEIGYGKGNEIGSSWYQEAQLKRHGINSNQLVQYPQLAAGHLRNLATVIALQFDYSHGDVNVAVFGHSKWLAKHVLAGRHSNNLGVWRTTHSLQVADTKMPPRYTYELGPANEAAALVLPGTLPQKETAAGRANCNVKVSPAFTESP